MDDLMFNKEKRKLNKEYLVIFDEVPCMQDYSCSREEYIAALREAIRTKQKICTLLMRKGKPMNKESLI